MIGQALRTESTNHPFVVEPEIIAILSDGGAPI